MSTAEEVSDENRPPLALQGEVSALRAQVAELTASNTALKSENNELKSANGELKSANAELLASNSSLGLENDALKQALRDAGIEQEAPASQSSRLERVHGNDHQATSDTNEADDEHAHTAAEDQIQAEILESEAVAKLQRVQVVYQEEDRSEWSHSQWHELMQSEADDADSIGPVRLATSVYEELDASLKPPKPVKRVVGSFPDMSSFTAPMDYLAAGAFRIVLKTEISGKPVVLKVSKSTSGRAKKDDYNEWAISEKLLPHPNVVQVMGVCPAFKHPTLKHIGSTALVVPFKENGDLHSFLDRTDFDPQDEWQLANVMFGMVEGIRSLHEQGVIHRDIALRNFLVDDNGRVQLNDLGLARDLRDNRLTVETVDEKNGKEKLEVLTEKDTSLAWRWTAPESFGGKFSKKSDVWMLGQTMIELVTGHHPWPQFESSKTLREAVNAKELEYTSLSSIPKFIRDLVSKCCEFEPSNRPTTQELSLLLRERKYAVEYNAPGFELHNAAANETDFEQVLVRLSESEDPDFKDKNGMTALHVAALRAEPDILNTLMYEKAPSDYTHYNPPEQFKHTCSFYIGDRVNNTAFHYIAATKDMPYGKLFEFFERVHEVKWRASSEIRFTQQQLRPPIHELNAFGETPFYIAVSRGHCAIVSCFDRIHTAVYGEDAKGESVKMCHGHSFLHCAIERKNDDMIKKLIALGGAKYGVNTKDTSGRTPLILATLMGYSAGVALLLGDPSTEVNRPFGDRGPALHIACKATDFETVSELLRSPRVDVNVKNARGYPLVWTTLDVRIFKALINHPDTNVNVCLGNNVEDIGGGNTLLRQLCKYIVGKEFCSSAVYETKSHERTPEESRKPLDVLDVLLLHESLDVNAYSTDHHNRLPALIIACQIRGTSQWCENAVMVLKKLCTHPQIDVNARDRSSIPALFYAVRSPAALEVLLSHQNIDVNTKHEGMTALDCAYAFRQRESARMLLSHPKIDQNDVNRVTSDSYVPTYMSIKG